MTHPQLRADLFFLSVVLLMMALYWLLPRWSRPGIFFSVSVDPRFPESDDGRRILRRYRSEACGSLMVALALILAGSFSQHALVVLLGFLCLVFGPFSAIWRAHKRVLPHAAAVSTVRTASLAPRPRQLPGGWLVQFGPFLILLLTGLYLSAHWEQIPARFPVHWGANGQPNGWSTHTLSGVFGPLVFGACMILFISLLGYVGWHSARRAISRSGLPGDDHANQVASVNLAIEYFLAINFSLVAMIPLTGSPNLVSVITLGMLALIAVLFFRVGKSKAAAASASTPPDGAPDACWKWGLFYFNPQDAALLVEKRIGIGYALNFARPMAWVLVFIMVFLPLGLVMTVGRWSH